MESAIKQKTKYICEYFIYLSLYYGNGVSVKYGNNEMFNKVDNNEYLYIKRRSDDVNTAMVYLMDKYIPYTSVCLSHYDVKWSMTYDDVVVDIEYYNYEPTYYYLDLGNYHSIMYDTNVLTVNVDSSLSDFFEDVDRVLRKYQERGNIDVVDNLRKKMGEKIGHPDIHLPIESANFTPF